MNTSTDIKTIAPALLKAQKAIGAAKKGSSNPFFHSKYADLGAIMEACKDALNDNGITVLQPVMKDVVETILVHESGEWMSSETPIVIKEQNNPQAVGSAISYARRYGLQSMVFIPAEDDDGNQATNTKPVVHAVATTAFPDDEGPVAHPQTQEGWCTIHNEQMRKFTKNGASWWSHKADEGWCNGGK